MSCSTGSPARSRSSSEPAGARRRASGFTLIEILVALIVLTVALGAFLQLFTSGMRATTAAEARTLAVLLAQSRLAAIGIESPIREGSYDGAFDRRFRWTTEVEPLADADPSLGDSDSLIYRISVTVSWDEPRGGGSVTLDSARLGTVDEVRGGRP